MSSPAPVVPPRPEPVLQAAKWTSYILGAIAAVGTALTAVGATAGWSWATVSGAVVAAITTTLSASIPRILAQGARAQVTPESDPMDMNGRPLVPADFTHAEAPSMGPDVVSA